MSTLLSVGTRLRSSLSWIPTKLGAVNCHVMLQVIV